LYVACLRDLRLNMNKSTFFFLASAFLLAVQPALTQTHETFATRPDKRRERVQAARARAQADRAVARQWARMHGLQMRVVDHGSVSELMAIRNGRPIYYTTLNKNAAISTAANLLHSSSPYNIAGSNVTVGVWDGGHARATHNEFGGRVSLGDMGVMDPHATHVCGTIGASGLNANAGGMAPACDIVSYDWSSDDAEMTSVAASYPGESGTVYLSNHSYGTISGWYGNYWYGEDISQEESEYFGQYNAFARDWDEIVYDAPYYLPFKAAGNDRSDEAPSNGSTFYYYDGGWQSGTYNSAIHPPGDGYIDAGYDTIQPKGNAKNIMTVGAVGDAVSGGSRYLGGATMEYYSSWGPADDGRIKPDIVANGYELTSTGSGSDSSYITSSGTSMAAPNACGSAALLVDYYDDRFPGEAMRASTLKGLIIHTADDLGNPGPDYASGWGLMNTKAAADMIKAYADGSLMCMTEARLHSTTNQSDSFSIYSAGTPLRVTLCWTDPPGTATDELDSRTPRLVNDLDLKVIGPGGTHYPYKLNYSDPAANATANSENDVDNVEQVYIASPAAGIYTITIDYDGLLSGNAQWYSLLISGISNDSDGDGMPDGWEYNYFSSLTGGVATADSDGDGRDNLSEYISGHDPMSALSYFEVTSLTPPLSGSGAPFILSWDSVSGRVYRVSWTDSMSYSSPFMDISGDMPYPAGIYTDTVERAGSDHFYKLEVRVGP
jgi:hypothetical protein